MNTWSKASDRASVVKAGVNATIIWDFDGVVADTEPVHAESYRILLEHRGYEVEEDFFLALIGHTEREIWAMLANDGAPVTDVNHLIDERRELVLELAIDVLQPSWLASDLMGYLTSVAKRQVILSNGDYRTIKTLLDCWNLADFVEIPQQGAVGEKADLLANFLESGDCLTIEDNAHYLQMAMDAGSFCVGVLHSMSQSSSLPAHVIVSI